MQPINFEIYVLLKIFRRQHRMLIQSIYLDLNRLIRMRMLIHDLLEVRIGLTIGVGPIADGHIVLLDTGIQL